MNIPYITLNFGARIERTFLHGKLMKDCDTDIFYLSENIVDKKGLYVFMHGSNVCILYYWGTGGLCVYADDKEANKYAMELAQNPPVSF